jgi:hypothetical protein
MGTKVTDAIVDYQRNRYALEVSTVELWASGYGFMLEQEGSSYRLLYQV